jgi:hypothetical protein
MAMAFAGSLLSTHTSALSEDGSESTALLIEHITGDAQSTPVTRAFLLLKLADGFLLSARRHELEPNLRRKTSMRPLKSSEITTLSIAWLDQLSSQSRKFRSNTSTYPYSTDQLMGAEDAIKSSLAELDKTTDQPAKIYLYFIAARLYQEMGNSRGMKDCDEIVKTACESCERSSEINEDEIKATTSIFNAMANQLIFVQIPLFEPPKREVAQPPLKNFTQAEYSDCKKLKLRSVAIADRLSSSSVVRRRVHRDLSLWYQRLGKYELAEKEKQILFELVGNDDDGVLYPKMVGCGHVVWWDPSAGKHGFGCGMG